MRMKQRNSVFSFCTVAMLLISGLFTAAAEERRDAVPAGKTVLSFVDRLILNPGVEALVIGYFPVIRGIPGPLFSGTARNETAAFFTYSLNAAGGTVLDNGGGPNVPGDTSVALLPSGESFKVYYNAVPNQSWSDPDSFSAGELVATFKSAPGTSTSSGPVTLVTQSYLFESSRDFVFDGKTYNFKNLVPHGFTVSSFGSNIPLGGGTTPPTFPLVFTGAGSGIAVGGPLSGLSDGRW